jgi:hypothetical protein
MAGDLQGALVPLQDALERFQGTGTGDYWPGEIMSRLSAVYPMMGTFDRAEELLRSAMGAYRHTLVSSIGAPATAMQMAAIALARGDHERALRPAAFCQATAERTGSEPPWAIMMIPRFAEFREAARVSLDEETIERLWAEGSAMDMDQAVAYALGEAT